jgi:hypothetical protein
VSDEFDDLAASVSAPAATATSFDTGNVYGIPPSLASSPILWAPGQPGRPAAVGDFYETELRGIVADVRAPAQPGAGPLTSSFLDAMNALYGVGDAAIPREQVPQLQQLLLAGGFYRAGYYSRRDPLDVNYGVIDDDTEAAWRGALERAAKSRRVIWDVLADAAKRRETGVYGRRGSALSGSGAGSGQSRPIYLTSPEDLKALAADVAQATLGRGAVDQKMIDAFVARYHGKEREAQQRAYAGGASVRPPDPRAAFEGQLRADLPAEAGAHDIARLFEAILPSFVGGPGG